jgi:hypothetical protein
MRRISEWERGKTFNDYLRVNLKKGNTVKRHYIHRLVYTSYHGHIPEGLHVDHIDNNCRNNFLENLQLLTPEANREKQRQYLEVNAIQPDIIKAVIIKDGREVKSYINLYSAARALKIPLKDIKKGISTGFVIDNERTLYQTNSAGVPITFPESLKRLSNEMMIRVNYDCSLPKNTWIKVGDIRKGKYSKDEPKPE